MELQNVMSPASSGITTSELVALEAVPGGSDPIQVDVVPEEGSIDHFVFIFKTVMIICSTCKFEE